MGESNLEAKRQIALLKNLLSKIFLKHQEDTLV